MELNFGGIGVRTDPKTRAMVRARVQRYTLLLADHSAQGLRESAEIYYLILIGHIGESQGGDMAFPDTYWEPLSAKWLDIKRKRGLTEEIWEATGEIKQSIRVFDIVKTQTQIKIYVGLKDVSPDVMKKALINEFGSFVLVQRGWGTHPYEVPARPLFEPAKREILHTYRGEIVENFAKAARMAFSKLEKITGKDLKPGRGSYQVLRGGVIKETRV